MSLLLRSPQDFQEKNEIEKRANRFSNKLMIPCEEEIHLITISKIKYCQASSNYCQIHFSDKASIICSKTLKKVESYLPNIHFFRVHRSYVINIFCITSISDEVILEGGVSIPIARSRRKELLERLNNLYASVS